jgi:GTP cyclohydrolase I
MAYNYQGVKDAVSSLIVALGENLSDENLQGTPDRVARMYKEILNGKEIDVDQYVRLFPSDYDEMVIIKDIPFYSFCAHHLALFHGKMHIGYVPTKKVIGISKIVRIARVFCKRLQIQEELTRQIADKLTELLSPVGVMVWIEAEHTCMTIRGARSAGAKTITSVVRGCFADTTKLARQEFLAAIK